MSGPREQARAPVAISLVALALLGIVSASRLPGFPIEFLYAFLVSGTLRLVMGRDLERLAPRAVLQGIGTVLALVSVFWLIDRMATGGGAHVLVGALAVLAAMQALFILGRLRGSRREVGGIEFDQPMSGAYPVILISTVHAIGTAGLMKDLPTLGLSVLYTAVLLWTLLLLERLVRAERPPPRSVNTRRVRFSARDPLPTRAALKTFGLLVLIGFPLGLVLYFVVPRFGKDAKPSHDFASDTAGTADPDRDLFEGRRLAREFMTGPSSETQVVEFGSVGKIKESHLPVFQVMHADGTRPVGVYLRDNVLDTYEPSGRWRGSPSLNKVGAAILRPDEAGWFYLEPERGINPTWERQTETLQITTLRSGFGRWYLMPWPQRARLLRGLPDRKPLTRCTIHKRGSHTLTLRIPGALRHEFKKSDMIELEYVSQRRDDAELMGAISNASVAPLNTYLQIPERTQRALQPIAETVVRAQEDPWLRARMLEAYLKAEPFEYTLAVPELDPDEKVVDFLTNVKRGHCEIYATALVMMLRSLGHPARYARGFWGGDTLGDPDSEQGSVVMRLSHYHAWTEIYLDEIGWVALNPTPPDRRATDAGADEHALGEGVDAEGNPIAAPSGESPDATILEFGSEEYDAFWRGVGDQVVGGIRAIATFLFSSASGYVGILLLVLIAGVSLVFRRRHAVRAAATAAGGTIPRGPYGRALLLLAKKGIHRPASQTPRELVTWVEMRLPPAAEPLSELTTCFERERYGGEAGAATSAEAKEALAALTDVVNASKNA